MSNKAELIKIAEKGAFHRDNIKSLIKADFMNINDGNKELSRIYSVLSNRYGYSTRQIMRICNG